MTALDFILLALACNRWTRLVVADELLRPFREKVRDWADDGRPRYSADGTRDDWRGKVDYLVTCPHCVGVYAAAGVAAVWQWAPRWGLLWWGLVVVPAVAAVTSLIAITLGHLED